MVHRFTIHSGKIAQLSWLHLCYDSTNSEKSNVIQMDQNNLSATVECQSVQQSNNNNAGVIPNRFSALCLHSFKSVVPITRLFKTKVFNIIMLHVCFLLQRFIIM